MSRAIPLLLFLLLPAASALASEPLPYRPARDDQVLERAATPRDAVGAELRERRSALALQPDDLPLALSFARAAIRLGRSEQDPRYFGYAESALQPWLNSAQPPADVRLLRAVIRQWRHQFAEAIGDLDVLIAANGELATEARLIRASLRLVAGNPLTALSDCAALVGHSDLLTATICIANANSVRGRARSSLQTVEALLQRPAGATPELLIWAQTTAAEIAVRLGDQDRAQAHYDEALKQMDDHEVRDPYLLASWADAQLQWQRPAAVIARLQGLERIDNLLLRLAIAECRSGPALAAVCTEHRHLLGQRFEDTRRRGDFVHQREYALFLLDLQQDAPAALAVAVDNWKQQREPIDAQLVLRAALSAHKAVAAQAVLDWMRQTGIEDERLQSLAARLGSESRA